ncbi:hypothetical protein [Natronorarus salvus]|uniref:hypothetical protein n=1 Tax=Natronorarus salvus TaxID=3117733 RepID=UPI002F2605AF
MTREIRISIDDDEVFERMRARKNELDLSWEEVLHRGLRRSRGGYGVGAGTGGRWSAPEADLADELQREIRQKVANSIRASVGGLGPEPTGWEDDLDEEMSALSAAEDAVVVFEGSEDDPSCQIPLRVSLRTDRNGLAVEVVAIRRGRGVEGMNAFPPEARRRIVESLARGETATLRIEEGIEEYPIVPRLAWSRDEAGRPTVVEVSVEDVSFDDGR